MADGSLTPLSFLRPAVLGGRPLAALTEFHRVLRPGGELRFYEHVRSRDFLFAGFQQAADLVWPRLMGGCHVRRQTQRAIDQAQRIVLVTSGSEYSGDGK